MLEAPVPDPWSEASTKGEGGEDITYYYNTESEESTYSHPLDAWIKVGATTLPSLYTMHCPCR